MMHRRAVSVIVGIMLLFGSTCAWANSVETIPQGIFALGLKWGYKWSTKRFGNSWGTDTVSIVDDYNITVTGADLAPDVYTTEDVIGRLDVEYDSYGMEISVTAAYGITDNLAFMMIIPVQYTNNKFNVELLDSNMTMLRGAGDAPMGFVRAGASDPVLTTEDFFEVITCTANTPLCNFRYKPPRDWSRWGLGEVITGFRYKFFDNQTWRQGITVFNKWPTGRHKNTDDIFDINFGDQNFDIGFWYGVDYLPIPELMFNVSFGYTEQLPFKKEKRLWGRTFDEAADEQGTIPITDYWRKVMTNIDYGGNWDVYFGGTWSFLPYLGYSNEFYFFWKYADNYWVEERPSDLKGNPWDPDFRAMEWGTQTSALEMTNAIAFSTIYWVQRGEFPVPFNFSIGHTMGIAGKDFDQQNSIWISLDLIGSIYMFDTADDSVKDEELEDFKLPARADGEDGEDLDGPLATETKSQRKLREAEKYQNSFGKVRKYGW